MLAVGEIELCQPDGVGRASFQLEGRGEGLSAAGVATTDSEAAAGAADDSGCSRSSDRSRVLEDFERPGHG